MRDWSTSAEISALKQGFHNFQEKKKKAPKGVLQRGSERSMLGEQNGTWDLEGKFQVTLVECGRKPCSPAVSRELETGPGAAKAEFFLQLHSSSHCQDILHAVGMYLWPLSSGTQPLTLATAEQHRQMPSQIPTPWKALVSHWRWRTSLLESSTAHVLGCWRSSPAMCKGWDPLYAAFCVQQSPSLSQESQILCCWTLALLLPSALGHWPSFSHWYLDV